MNKANHKYSSSNDAEGAMQEENFEPLSSESEILLKVRGVQHTYSSGSFGSMCNKSAKTTEVLTGLDMDVCRGEVFGYL